MLELLIKGLIGYLCGSVVGGLAVGRLRGGVDIRSLGSGNPGGTNALRTQGAGFAAWVLAIDIGKAVLAVGLIPGLALPGIPETPQVARETVALVVAAATVFGHVCPLYHGFQGGKGIATLVGCYAVLAPGLLVPFATVWLAVALGSGYVGLASILGSAAAATFAVVQGRTPGLILFAWLMAAFMLLTHRGNLARMRAGTEHRLSWRGRSGGVQ
jgi:glycerol-3-phosphate acyltransferase PlsY